MEPTDGNPIDNEVNEKVVNDVKLDSDGNISGADLNTDNLLEYISNGYGLFGTGGYIELSRRFFLGVPSYIWALIAMAMSVNIVVIVFKVIRGM